MFNIQLLWESGSRIGECLALWLEDFIIDAREVNLKYRGELPNLADIKTVCSPRNVSKKYLYDKHFEHIETLRKQQQDLPSQKQVKRNMTDASKDVLIASKNKRIKELEEDKRLKGILERRYGEYYDKGI